MEVPGDFPGDPVVKTLHFQCRGLWVRGNCLKRWLENRFLSDITMKQFSKV